MQVTTPTPTPPSLWNQSNINLNPHLQKPAKPYSTHINITTNLSAITLTKNAMNYPRDLTVKTSKNALIANTTDQPADPVLIQL